MKWIQTVIPAALGCLGILAAAPSGEPTAAQRGEKALLTRSFTPPAISLPAYQDLWKHWGEGLDSPPADYAKAFRERYGLHEAPYPNNGYPMGFREASTLLGKGLATDCLFCHGGAIAGKSYLGLGNTTFDYQTFSEDLMKAQGRKEAKTPFHFCNVRGTIEAGAFTVYLLGLREPDLSLRTSGLLDLGVEDQMCEDTPAWWLLKKKKTMYHTGGSDARSVRSLMQFMMSPLNPPSAFDKAEAAFADIREYLLSLQPPKYPLAVNQEVARRGETVFRQNCARCHGTYGADWTYPNKVVPLKEIGTDPVRHQGITKKFVDYYNQSWFAHGQGAYPGKITGGYQAPPLDGIWATAPYFHNGSAPTVYHVLNSRARPKIFTRSYRTDLDAYDAEKLGWKVQVLQRGPDPSLPGVEQRKVYATTQRGRGNGGHPFGDDLSEEERMAVIEYLKTL